MENLVKIYNEHKTKPLIEYKRVCNEMINNLKESGRQLPHNYWTYFTINDQRYYASLSPMYDLNKCQIFKVQGGKINFSERVFYRHILCLCFESLILCCLDFINDNIDEGENR